MLQPLTAEPEVTPDDATPRVRRRVRRPFRLVLLGVLAVVLVASAACVGLGRSCRSHRTGDASGLQAEREAVMAQTQQFVLRVNTYGPVPARLAGPDAGRTARGSRP